MTVGRGAEKKVGRKTLGQEASGVVRQIVSETVESKAVRRCDREAVRQVAI